MKQSMKIVCLVLAGLGLLAGAPMALAAGSSNDPGGARQQHTDVGCLMCHSGDRIQGVLADGSTVSLSVPGELMDGSVHSRAGLTCISCHSTTPTFPHNPDGGTRCSNCHQASGVSLQSISVPLKYPSRRAMSLELNQNCRSCHAELFELAAVGEHARILKAGNLEAPVCIDCHGSHPVGGGVKAPETSTAICSGCHASADSTYRASVHGSSMLQRNPGVPTCTNCHGSHAIRGPYSQGFRSESIESCGACHSGRSLTASYGLTGDELTSYRRDLHGMAAAIANRAEGEIPGSQAVCYDCHGTHEIGRAGAGSSTAETELLLSACQRCHPGADENLLASQAGHEPTTDDPIPGLSAIARTYKLLIGGTLGGSLLYIAADIRKRKAEKRRVIDDND